MKQGFFVAFLALSLAPAAFAAEPAALKVTLKGIQAGKPIPAKYAFCKPDAKKRTVDGGNVSPGISWSKGPEGTKSYVIIMHDPDVPTVFDDANKEGKTLPATMPRQNFYHWVLVDIPADRTSLAEGQDSDKVKKPGKPAGVMEYGTRGVNDYGKFMGGMFGGYDGPCPPWNDERLHHYTFTVYALNVANLGIAGNFGAHDVERLLTGRTLAKGSVMATYTQYSGKKAAKPAKSKKK